MKTELISDLTHYLDGVFEDDLKVGNCEKPLHEEVQSWDIPMDLKRTLQWNWFNASFDGPRHFLYSVEDIIESDDRGRFMAEGLLQIGSCRNGDMIVIDFREETSPVLFVSHDEFWEDRECSPRRCAVLIYRSLAEFMLRTAEMKYVPLDWSTGMEYRKLFDEMES